MLSVGLISLLVCVPLFSYHITSSLFNRITSIILIYSAMLSINVFDIGTLSTGVGIYSGLFHVTTLSLGIEVFILLIGSILLLGWAPVTPFFSSLGKGKTNQNFSGNTSSVVTTQIPTISEYSLLILFTTIGIGLLISSSDLISMYLSIELQSFALYVLCTLYRNSESATSAGLKYFLLGGLSSALILLGTALIYAYTGLTQFESIYLLCQVLGSNNYLQPTYLGLVLILIGFLFKVSAAPLHNWAPDVYDGTPTVVTTWLTTMPKISIFVFLVELQTGLEGSFSSLSLVLSITDQSINIWKNLLLITSLLSLIIGTVLGLSQYRMKRLLAYSTISHVGFLLLCLAINSNESIHSFLFYLIQYSITNACVFLTLLAFSYQSEYFSMQNGPRTQNKIASKSFDTPFSIRNSNSSDIQLIADLRNQFSTNPVLAFTLTMCLFSIAGIPPLIGFFAKQMALYSAINAGYYFISIVAVLCSVISASYYLKIIRVMYFDYQEEVSTQNENTENTNNTISISGITNFKNTNSKISNVHSLTISVLTCIITLFILQPQILLNSSHLLALSLFYY
ncbi:unnamed protein product (mitochondrion) [Parajaminaea phylloscopi]|uniref:NADH-ubiquinone oxidoreductase chain 2 n=1 Tax=Parajaminaea phylloscopi TaxID=1463510 RepID=A0AB39A6Y4_9BASI